MKAMKEYPEVQDFISLLSPAEREQLQAELYAHDRTGHETLKLSWNHAPDRIRKGRELRIPGQLGGEVQKFDRRREDSAPRQDENR